MKPGQYIRKHRLSAGLSLRDLAAKLKVSHVFLGDLERGKKPVPERLVAELEQHVDGISAAALRKHLRESTPLHLEIFGVGDVERHLAAAFARRVEHGGFSEDEVKALWRILEGKDG